MTRTIGLALAAVLLSAPGTAQTLGYAPARDLPVQTPLWVSVEVSGPATVSVALQDGPAALIDAPLRFILDTAGMRTTSVSTIRPLKAGSRMVVSVSATPLSPDRPAAVRKFGIALDKYQNGTAVNASIAEPVQCTAAVCNVCYTLQDNAAVALDTFSVGGVKPVNDDFYTSGSQTKGAHRAPWNQDDDNGQRVASGRYYVVLESKNVGGTDQQRSDPFAVPPGPAPTTCK